MKFRSRGLYLLVITALTLSAAGCATAPRLQGAWVVENYDGVAPDPDATPAVPGPGRSVKILSGDRFSFGRAGADPRPQFGGGTWSLRDGIYRETIEYHWLPRFIGKTVAFRCRVDGDLWYHESLRGDHGENWGIIEVWRRVPDRD